MKLSDLNPQITGNSPDGVNQIIFDCPKCGKPYRILILAKFNQPHGPAGYWSWTFDVNATNGYDAITITPSINNPNHGRKKLCGWHGSIVNGEVINN